MPGTVNFLEDRGKICLVSERTESKCLGSRTAFTLLTLIHIWCLLVFFSRSPTTATFTVFPSDWRMISIDFLKQIEEELLHTVKKWKTDLTKCQRHLVFPGGHPSKYWPDPTLLNFADREAVLSTWYDRWHVVDELSLALWQWWQIFHTSVFFFFFTKLHYHSTPAISLRSAPQGKHP